MEPIGRCAARTGKGERCRNPATYRAVVDGRVVGHCPVHARQVRRGSVVLWEPSSPDPPPDRPEQAWNAGDDAYVLRNASLPVDHVAQLMGRSASSVLRRLSELRRREGRK